MKVLPMTLAALAVLVGCTSSKPTPTTGRILGTGSPCIGPRPIAGPGLKTLHPRVTVTLSDQVNTRAVPRVVTVSAPYHFSFVVQPGTYRLSENGATATVDVHRSQTVHTKLDALCQ